MFCRPAWAPVAVACVAFLAFAQTPPVSIPAKDFGPVRTGFCVGGAFGAGGIAMTPSTHVLRAGLADKFGLGVDNRSVAEAVERTEGAYRGGMTCVS